MQSSNQAIPGKQYMLSAIRRKQLDRFPTTVLIGPYCAQLAGYTVKEILKDAQKSAQAHLAFYDQFHPDSLIVYNDIYLELEAMGCELDFPEDAVSHPKRAMLEDKKNLAGLKIPDPQKDGRLPYFLELCERVAGQVRHEASVGLGHSGPWNLAMHLRGAEQFLIDSIEDPGFVHDLMAFTTQVVKTLGDTLIEQGFMPSLGEASASCSLISPQMYRDFILPYHKALCRHFRARKAMMSLHICGYIDPILEDVLGCGIGFLSLDAPSSLEKAVAASAGKVVIMGNVPTHLFADGSAVDMENAVDACIQTAGKTGRFVLASGCEIPLNSTEDRVAHFFEYGHKAGRAFIQGVEN
ncbi:MAG: uroporphyrinogen decarboxylase family protein [Thermodesulfobacteriota bacterium]